MSTKPASKTTVTKYTTPAKKKRGRSAKPRVVTTKTITTQGNQMPVKRSNVVKRPVIPRNSVNRQVKHLVSQLLAPVDWDVHAEMAPLRVPRLVSRPVAAARIPFTLKVPPALVNQGAMQVRIAPDPFHLLQISRPPVNPIPILDAYYSQSMTTGVDNGIEVTLDEDIQIANGHVSSVILPHDATIPECWYLRAQDEDLKLGFKGYQTGPISFANTNSWQMGANNTTGDDINLTCKLYALQGSLASGYTALNVCSTTVSIASGNTGFASFITFNAFMTACASADAIAFSAVFENQNTHANRVPKGVNLQIKYLGNQPTFQAAWSLDTFSIFQLGGKATENLMHELNGCAKMAVTAVNVRISDFVAALNKNGILSATQLSAGQASQFPINPIAAMSLIDTVGISGYSYKMRPEQEGLFMNLHFDNPNDWERKAPNFYANAEYNVADCDLPVGLIALSYEGDISPVGEHPISIIGSINVEWETDSIGYELEFPPSNFGRFNEAYFQALQRSNPFCENPEHLKYVKKKIAAVLNHPAMKSVGNFLLREGLPLLEGAAIAALAL